MGGAVAEAVAVAVTGELVEALTGLVAVVLAGAILGAAAGASQWIMLRRHFSDAYRWVVASVAGMAVGYAAAATVVNQVPLLAGAVIGVAAGASQWIILRRHFSGAYRWVLASVAGMTVGFVVGYSLNLDPIQASFEGVLYGAVSGAVSRGVGGAVGGAITAMPMFTLLQHARMGDAANPAGAEG